MTKIQAYTHKSIHYHYARIEQFTLYEILVYEVLKNMEVASFLMG